MDLKSLRKQWTYQLFMSMDDHCFPIAAPSLWLDFVMHCIVLALTTVLLFDHDLKPDQSEKPNMFGFVMFGLTCVTFLLSLALSILVKQCSVSFHSWSWQFVTMRRLCFVLCVPPLANLSLLVLQSQLPLSCAVPFGILEFLVCLDVTRNCLRALVHAAGINRRMFLGEEYDHDHLDVDPMTHMSDLLSQRDVLYWMKPLEKVGLPTVLASLVIECLVGSVVEEVRFQVSSPGIQSLIIFSDRDHRWCHQYLLSPEQFLQLCDWCDQHETQMLGPEKIFNEARNMQLWANRYTRFICHK